MISSFVTALALTYLLGVLEEWNQTVFFVVFLGAMALLLVTTIVLESTGDVDYDLLQFAASVAGALLGYPGGKAHYSRTFGGADHER